MHMPREVREREEEGDRTGNSNRKQRKAEMWILQENNKNHKQRRSESPRVYSLQQMQEAITPVGTMLRRNQRRNEKTEQSHVGMPYVYGERGRTGKKKNRAERTGQGGGICLRWRS